MKTNSSSKRKKNTYNAVLSLIILIMLAVEVNLVYNIDLIYGERIREDMHSASEMFTSCIGNAASNVTKLSAASAVNQLDDLIDENRWQGPVLSKGRGVVYGPSGKETYYNLNMSIVVSVMHRMGYNYEYWVRDDGVKMLGDYVMVAANLNLRPKGTIVMTSVGPGIVCDTGGFAKRNPTQIDIATTW